VKENKATGTTSDVQLSKGKRVCDERKGEKEKNMTATTGELKGPEQETKLAGINRNGKGNGNEILERGWRPLDGDWRRTSLCLREA